MSAAVQVLPPGPERDELRFDSNQFDRRRIRYDSLAYSDVEFTHTERRKGRTARAGVPEFARDDRKLRTVLAAFILASFSHSLIPRALRWAETATSSELNELAALKLRRCSLGEGGRRVEVQHLARAVAHCGGRLQFLARIAFLSWRCNWDSADVAGETGASPQHVRLTLYKLVLLARRLGFETYAPVQKSFRPRPPVPLVVEPDPARAAEMVARARATMQDEIEKLERQAEVRHLSYHGRRARGVCVNNCGQLSRPGRVTCAECGRRDARRKRRLRIVSLSS